MGYLSILGSTGTTTTTPYYYHYPLQLFTSTISAFSALSARETSHFSILSLPTTTIHFHYLCVLAAPCGPSGSLRSGNPMPTARAHFVSAGEIPRSPFPIPQSPHNPTVKNSAKTPKSITYLKKYKKVSVCPCKAGSKSDILCTCSPDMVKHEGLSERIFEISMFEKTVNVCVRGQ